MASRLFARRLLTTHQPSTFALSTSRSRTFQTTTRLLQDAVVAPVRRPVGAFRGGLFGFLLGSTLAGASVYYYILEEYKVSNEMLTEDIYALQAAVQRIHTYVSELEAKYDQQQSKK